MFNAGDRVLEDGEPGLITAIRDGCFMIKRDGESFSHASCGVDDTDNWLVHERPTRATSTSDYHSRKFDAGKARVDLIPGEALLALGDILSYGCDKYEEDSWKLVPDAEKRYRAALGRHMAAIAKGETVDAESGRLHIDHVLTNAAFLSYFAHQSKAAA